MKDTTHLNTLVSTRFTPRGREREEEDIHWHRRADKLVNDDMQHTSLSLPMSSLTSLANTLCNMNEAKGSFLVVKLLAAIEKVGMQVALLLPVLVMTAWSSPEAAPCEIGLAGVRPIVLMATFNTHCGALSLRWTGLSISYGVLRGAFADP